MTSRKIRRLVILCGYNASTNDLLLKAGTTDLQEALGELSDRMGKTLCSVELDVMWPPERLPLAAQLQRKGARTKDVRLFLSKDENVDGEAIRPFTTAYQCSHLVVVSDSGAPNLPNWRGVSRGVVVTHLPLEKWPSLIIDIGLDIALFYSDLVTSSYTDHASKQDYSSRKSEFVTKRLAGKTSFYGTPGEPEPTYLPLAMLCRSPRGLDYDALVSFWNTFRNTQTIYARPQPVSYLSEEMYKQPLLATKRYSPETLAKELAEKYKHKNQISIRRLTQLLRDKKPGQYLLVRAVRGIRLKKEQAQISFVFKKYRVGALAILDAQHLGSLKHFLVRGYIWIYPFEVTNES